MVGVHHEQKLVGEVVVEHVEMWVVADNPEQKVVVVQRKTVVVVDFVYLNDRILMWVVVEVELHDGDDEGVVDDDGVGVHQHA